MEGQRGRVSVVIPAFNRAGTVARAVRSALAQTHRDLEVIVVDDASTDATRAAVAAIRDPRVRCLRHGENRGGSAARNTGIAAATGEYVAFLDSDDEWDPPKIERQLAALATRDQADWAGAYCGHRFVSGERTFVHSPALEGRFPRELLLMAVPVAGGSTLLVTTAAARELGGFDAGFRRHQDFEFLLRFFGRHRLCAVPEPLATVHGVHVPPSPVVVEVKRRFLEAFRAQIDALGKRDARQVRALHWYQAAEACAADRRVGAMLRCLGRGLAQGRLPRRLKVMAVAFVRGKMPD
jgi:hypothetical protein